MIAAAIVLAILLLIYFLRIGVTAEYTEDGLALDTYLGPLKYTVLSTAKRTKRWKEKREKRNKDIIKPGRLETLKNDLPKIKNTLEKHHRRLVIDDLTIYYMSAASDAAAAALYFGAASVGFGVILPLIENNFKIKKRDLRAAVDFNATEPYIYIKAKLSLALWELIYFSFGLVKDLITGESKEQKRERRYNHG